jgi:hypothetical protein
MTFDHSREEKRSGARTKIEAKQKYTAAGQGKRITPELFELAQLFYEKYPLLIFHYFLSDGLM